jgi:hypothetical protein
VSANLVRVAIKPYAIDPAFPGIGTAVVFFLSDGSHKYAKFPVPCETTQIIHALRQLADEIQKDYHKG